jgi:hypothetical protein
MILRKSLTEKYRSGVSETLVNPITYNSYKTKKTDDEAFHCEAT